MAAITLPAQFHIICGRGEGRAMLARADLFWESRDVGLGNAAPPSQLLTIHSGSAGVTDTLKIMAQLVRQYKVDPQIRHTSAGLIQSCPEKDDLCEAATLQNWVRSNIRYTGDVYETETVQTPIFTLTNRWGDCDDQANLLASMLNAVGIGAAFCAVGVDGGAYSHVMTFAILHDGTHVSLETTVTTDPQTGDFVGPGWFPANATSRRLFHI